MVKGIRYDLLSRPYDRMGVSISCLYFNRLCCVYIIAFHHMCLLLYHCITVSQVLRGMADLHRTLLPGWAAHQATGVTLLDPDSSVSSSTDFSRLNSFD